MTPVKQHKDIEAQNFTRVQKIRIFVSVQLEVIVRRS